MALLTKAEEVREIALREAGLHLGKTHHVRVNNDGAHPLHDEVLLAAQQFEQYILTGTIPGVP